MNSATSHGEVVVLTSGPCGYGSASSGTYVAEEAFAGEFARTERACHVRGIIGSLVCERVELGPEWWRV